MRCRCGVRAKEDAEDAALRGGAEMQRRVLELIATGQSLEQVLHELVLGMERQHPGMCGCVLLVAEDGAHLQTAAAPHLAPEYQALVEQLIRVGPSGGSCGTACFRRERVVVEDIAHDPLWASYTDIAERFGLHACWSEPVFSRDGRVLGSFAMYYLEPRAP